ncbi:hypothetical protein ACTFIR_007019 [Dictyostelium discoideum]
MNKLFKIVIILLILVNIIYCNEKYYFKISWSDIKCLNKPANSCNKYNIEKINNKTQQQQQQHQLLLNKISINKLIVHEKSPLSKIKHFFINKESNNIIVYGNIVKNINGNDLNVIRVYKQLPLGNEMQITDRYYTFNNSNFPCLNRTNNGEKPCYQLISTLVNYNNNYNNYLISKIVYPYQENVGKYFDNHWLNYKSVIQDHSKLIALGTINNNNEMIVSNAYISIPDPIEKCLPPKSVQCNSQSIITNSRDSNRCLANSTCTPIAFNGNITVIDPTCPKGYYLTFLLDIMVED